MGIITADGVAVGTITLNKGNLVQVLKKDDDRTCVTIRVIDVNGGKTGWISISSYGPVCGWVQKENVYIPMPALTVVKYELAKMKIGINIGENSIYVDLYQLA